MSLKEIILNIYNTSYIKRSEYYILFMKKLDYDKKLYHIYK